MCAVIVLVLLVCISYHQPIAAQDQVIDLLTQLSTLSSHLKTKYPAYNPEEYLENVIEIVDPQNIEGSTENSDFSR